MKNMYFVSSVAFLSILVPAFVSADSIQVNSATYGQNCGVSVGNVTNYVSRACDGKKSCNYDINHLTIGDPAVNCATDFLVEYQCISDEIKTFVSPEASGKSAKLHCK